MFTTMRLVTIQTHGRGVVGAVYEALAIGWSFSLENGWTCRRKMRMSGLCKVEMSAFMDGRGPHGNGANHFEPTRTGPIEGVARGTAETADAGSSRRATENKRPPRAADAAAPARARRSLPGSRTARSTIESQAGGPLGAEDSGTPAPALCGFRTHTGC